MTNTRWYNKHNQILFFMSACRMFIYGVKRKFLLNTSVTSQHLLMGHNLSNSSQASLRPMKEGFFEKFCLGH